MDELDTFLERFVNRTDMWGLQWVSRDGSYCGYINQNPNMDRKNGRFRFEPISRNLLIRHLRGALTIALSATDQSGCSKWLAFDSDKEDGSLDKIEKAVKTCGGYCIRESKRPGRDGHLWLLLDKPMPAMLLITLGDVFKKVADVDSEIEIFPKFANKYSQLRAPLGVNRKPEAKGARGWFEGVEPNPLAQLKWLSKQPLNRADLFTREAEKYLHLCPPIPQAPQQAVKTACRFRGIFKILDYVNARQVGNSYLAQCPVCASEGHDKHLDNLHINGDGIKFCCVFRGPGATHKAADIKGALVGRQRK